MKKSILFLLTTFTLLSANSALESLRGSLLELNTTLSNLYEKRANILLAYTALNSDVSAIRGEIDTISAQTYTLLTQEDVDAIASINTTLLTLATTLNQMTIDTSYLKEIQNVFTSKEAYLAMLQLSNDIGSMANEIDTMANRILAMADNIDTMGDLIVTTLGAQRATFSDIERLVLESQNNVMSVMQSYDMNSTLAEIATFSDALESMRLELVALQEGETTIEAISAKLLAGLTQKRENLDALTLSLEANSSFYDDEGAMRLLTVVVESSEVLNDVAATLDSVTLSVSILQNLANTSELNNVLTNIMASSQEILNLAKDIGVLSDTIVNMGGHINRFSSEMMADQSAISTNILAVFSTISDVQKAFVAVKR